MKSALRLERDGWPDAMEMTLGQVLFRSRFGVDEAKADFRRDAEATRAGNATDKSWKKVFGKRDDQ